MSVCVWQWVNARCIKREHIRLGVSEFMCDVCMCIIKFCTGWHRVYLFNIIKYLSRTSAWVRSDHKAKANLNTALIAIVAVPFFALRSLFATKLLTFIMNSLFIHAHGSISDSFSSSSASFACWMCVFVVQILFTFNYSSHVSVDVVVFSRRGKLSTCQYAYA